MGVMTRGYRCPENQLHFNDFSSNPINALNWTHWQFQQLNLLRIICERKLICSKTVAAFVKLVFEIRKLIFNTVLIKILVAYYAGKEVKPLQSVSVYNSGHPSFKL